jgi:hypothetical protein
MDQTNMLKGYADNYLNRDSEYNRGMFNDYRQQAMDYAGSQGNQGMRMAAAGANPFANEQYRGQMSAGLEQANNAYRVGMRDNQQLGANFMGMANQYKMHQEKLDWERKMFRQQKRASFTNNLIGVGGTLLGAALGGPLGAGLGQGILGMFKKPSIGSEAYTGGTPTQSYDDWRNSMFPPQSPYGPFAKPSLQAYEG